MEGKVILRPSILFSLIVVKYMQLKFTILFTFSDTLNKIFFQ